MNANPCESVANLLTSEPLSTAFYNHKPQQVARNLLGKILIRREPGSILAGRIVETEAYLGLNDAAAHAASGPTARNQVIFGPPGRAYVYFIYGNHYCLNVSCMPEGDAGCVLIRALEPLYGIAEMQVARKFTQKTDPSPSELRLLTSGPGRLAQALGITRIRDNGKDLTEISSDLLIVSDDFKPRRIVLTARIGLTKAADAPLRYVIGGNPFVSAKRVP